jgi:hypothetical protein
VPVEEHTFEFEEETLAELPDQAISASEQKEEHAFGEVSFEELAAAEPPKPIEFEAPVDESATAFTERAMPEILASIPTFEESSKPDFVRSAAMSVVHPGPAIETSTPVSEPASAAVSPAFAETAPVETAAPVAMTEEQLKAALASVSKDVIERIVWEVVPDLAEAMIKEAIRKIKEGH